MADKRDVHASSDEAQACDICKASAHDCVGEVDGALAKMREILTEVRPSNRPLAAAALGFLYLHAQAGGDTPALLQLMQLTLNEAHAYAHATIEEGDVEAWMKQECRESEVEVEHFVALHNTVNA